ncbi:MAG: NAD(P)H-binding protein [Aestuariivirga sp.]
MYFISGASGQLGQLVTQELSGKVNPKDVTLGSRHTGKLAGFAAKGFKTANFDFDDAVGMEKALNGHETLLLISGDGPTKERIAQQLAAIAAAKAAGVKRIVYTSFTNPTSKSHFTFAKAHEATEAALKASGLAYTSLRNNQYAENISGAVDYARQAGTLALPGSAGKVAFITRADIAKAAAAALAEKAPGNRIYEITGPKAYDLQEIAELLAAKWNKPVAAAELPQEAFAGMLSGMGLPPFLVEALQGIRAAVGAGEFETVSNDFEKLTGTKAESYESYLKRAA